MAKRHLGLYLGITALLVYFLAHTATDAFLSFHDDKGGDDWLQRAAVLNPLAAEPRMLTGYAYLEQGRREKRNDLLKAAIEQFTRAIRLNPFFYQAHLNLGKAYFLLSESEPQWVSDGIVSFKRAANIRGANLTVAMESARLMFSLWPLLKPEDQEFTRKLVLGIMHRVSQKDFESLVELWALYNRKIELMEELIARRPEFSNLVASALARNRQFNDQRRRLLNTGDHIRYQTLKRGADEELNQAQTESKPEVLLKLFKELGRVYRGYDRLIGQELFPEKPLLALRRRLGERLLSILVDEEGKWRPLASRQSVDFVVSELIQDSLVYEEVFELEEFLAKSGYYQEGDLKSFIARQRILLQTARNDQVIDQIETLQRQMAFIREDARADMIECLFLLCDAYRSSRLLTMAGKVLDTIEPLAPPPQRLLWQRYLIEKVIAVEADTTLIETWRGQFASSRLLTVQKNNQKFAVYLDENREITILLAPEIMEKVQSGQYNLIELSVGGKIVWDSYLSDENNMFKYAFPENFEGKEVNADITIS